MSVHVSKCVFCEMGVCRRISVCVYVCVNIQVPIFMRYVCERRAYECVFYEICICTCLCV